jgi:uroporphyrinogen decarboxylase
MISGRENFKRTIEFKSPHYVPCIIRVDLDWLHEKNQAKADQIRELQNRFPLDILDWLDVTQNLSEPENNEGIKRWVDEWGTGWQDDGFGAKAEFYPLREGYHQLNNYSFPNPNLPGRFDQVDLQLKNRGDRYVLASVWFTLFERLWMLRGFDNILIDPYLDKNDFRQLRDQIVEYNLAIIDHWLQRKVDGIFFSDDWGSQRALLINPEDWRKFYKPSYQKMFDRVRSGGAHVWMHLCGNIEDILPDLIDIGLNVLNPVQPQAMDMKLLSREFGSKVCFYGGVDVQGTMIYETPNDVKDEIHKLVNLFGSFNGGYIGGTSHSIMPETPLDNVIALYQTFLDLK